MTALLLLTLVLPAAGAVAAASLYRRSDLAGRVVATAFAGAAFLASVALYWHRDGYGWFAYQPLQQGQPAPSGIAPWHQLNVAWAPGLELRFHIGIDGISYPLVVLTTLLTLLCCVYTLWTVPGTRG